MPVDTQSLLRMNKAQLDELFHNAEAGPIPDGSAKGTALITPGTDKSDELAEIVRLFAWKGKSFDAERGVLRNRISALGINAIVATVYKGTSLLDGKDCIVLDYSKTSIVAKWIRDEIRQLSPGLYLGRVYWDDKPILHFSLEFEPAGGVV